MKGILKRGKLTVGIVTSLVLVTSALGQSSSSSQPQPAPKGTVRQLDISNKPWTGDFDRMLERRIVRVLVPYSRTPYFNERGTSVASPLATCVTSSAGSTKSTRKRWVSDP